MRRHHLLLLVPLLATACGMGASDKGSSTSSVSRPQKAQGAAAPAEVKRSVIRTATISVSVDDTAEAAGKAADLAQQLRGRVDSDRRSADGDGSAVLVLRVPPAQVERVLDAVAALGKEHRRDIADEDVTTSVVDLASRIATQRASVDRVRALLARAESLSDITKVEAELTRRQADLESMLARQEALSGQVELASVTATLTGSAPSGASHLPGFLDGLSGGWTALVGTARVVAVVAGAVLPFAWLPVLVLGGRVAWRRRRAAAV